MYLEFDKAQGSTYQRFLITPKLFVFLYASSLGCLLPFLPIFFRLNGLTAVQNGFLVAARYLVLFWAAPSLSFFASKLNGRKVVLVLAVLFGAVANATFLFTAKYQGHIRQNCQVNSTSNQSYQLSDYDTSAIIPTDFTHSDSSIANSSEKIMMYKTTNSFRNSFNKNNSTSRFQSLFNATSKIEEEIFGTIGLKLDKKFLTFLLIIMVGTLLSSPAKPLHELVTLAIIKEYKASYNLQRLSSCIGWSLMSCATAIAVYKLPCRFHLSKNAFDLHFCFHIFFATTALIFAMVMKSPNSKGSTKFKFGRILKVACKNPNIIMVIIAMAILGTAQSINSSYLFWYVQDLGGSELHFGLILLVSGLSQIPLLFGTKYLITWLGHGWMFFVSLFAFGSRFFLYSMTDNPFTIIPIEILHSLTSSSIWLTSMSMAVLVAPIGYERSMQNLFTASYYGLGMGCGGILTSVAYQLYGAIAVFQCGAAVCAVYSLAIALLQCLISPPDGNQGFPVNGDYYRVGVSSNSQSDWLLEALNADEEEIHYSRQ